MKACESAKGSGGRPDRHKWGNGRRDDGRDLDH